jgi:hypothetical protein
MKEGVRKNRLLIDWLNILELDVRKERQQVLEGWTLDTKISTRVVGIYIDCMGGNTQQRL